MSKILWGCEEIREYLGISEDRFYKMITAGLPGSKFDGQWCAHTDNLDDYMRKMTKLPMDRINSKKRENTA